MLLTRDQMMMVLASVLALACGNTTSSSGTATGTGPACSATAPCAERGTVCMGNGKCGVAECSDIADCSEFKTTSPLGVLCPQDPKPRACTSVECTPSSPCKNGGTCENGLCKGGTVIGTACSATNPCPSGQECAADGKCIAVTPGAGAVCDTCAADTDCADGSVCVTLGAEKRCAQKCDNSGSCESGFTCAAYGDVKACTPGKLECGGCLLQAYLGLCLELSEQRS